MVHHQVQLVVVVAAMAFGVASAAPGAEGSGRAWALTNTVGSDGITEGGLLSKHWQFFARMLGECGSRGLEACVGSKALSVVDGYLSQDSIPLADGVALIRRNSTERSDDEGPKPEGPLPQQLLDRFSRFLRSYAVQLRFPETNEEEVAIGLDEGRKLKKFLLPVVMGIGLKVLGVMPLVFGGLALLVGKAVFVSKLAFVLAALVALSSLMGSFRTGDATAAQQRLRLPQVLSQVLAPSSQNSGAGVSWPATSSYGSSGWSRRSAHDLAFGAQIPSDYHE